MSTLQKCWSTSRTSKDILLTLIRRKKCQIPSLSSPSSYHRSFVHQLYLPMNKFHRVGLAIFERNVACKKDLGAKLLQQTLKFNSSDSSKVLGKQPARMAIIFTCKVCDHRQTKTFSKIAYNEGVVIVDCDDCKNRHLIADNLGWFEHVGARNIEDIMKLKGEEVKKYSANGLVEIPAIDSND